MPTKEQEITFLKDLEQETEKFRVANPFVELDVQKPDALTCDKAIKAVIKLSSQLLGIPSKSAAISKT
uniref:Uncharacterized protein n=1 Tax=Romanomermis culicivorax TaxID=13658 RepID=A0A915HT47_ROMCU